MTTYIGEDMGKENTPPLLVRVKTGTTALEISMVILREIGNKLPQEREIPLLLYTQRMFNHTPKTCAQLCS